MTTVINNPEEKKSGNGNGSSGAAGVLIGAVIVVLVLVVVLFLSLPYLKKQISNVAQPVKPTINVTLPNIPDITISSTTATIKN